MSYVLHVSNLAEQDIAHAHARYAGQSTELAGRFMGRLEAIFVHVTDNPFLYAPFIENVRRAVMNRFPYSVFYSIESHEINIKAVLHHSRNPKLWKERLA